MPRRSLTLGTGALALAGAAAAAALALALAEHDAAAQQASGCPTTAVSPIHDAFHEPPQVHSRNGVLSVTLHAKPGRTTIDRPGIRSDLWNRQYPAPTLRVCPGDTLRVKLVNDLRKPTNLHVHGLHVSPEGHSDNIMVSIPPGASRQYVYRIPRDQPAGTYWYHPHRHGLTDPQVFAGMAGALIVEGSFDDLPGVAGVPERTLVVQETQIAKGRVVPVGKATDGKVRMLVNGRLRPRIDIAPGAIQRWRVVNASADRFLNIQVPGQKLSLINSDGNALRAASPRDSIVIPAGSRRDVLVRGGDAPAQLQTLAFEQKFENTRQQVLADVAPKGDPVDGQEMPDLLAPQPDLRDAQIDRRRVIDFQSAFPRFLINGKTFSHHRIDQTMKLGATEEWEIRNRSGEWHSFHIHVNPFQVVAVNGKPVEDVDYEDDVALSPYGSVTMRTRFDDFTGMFVFHCHILGHEDGGMMSLVQVVP